MSTISYDYADAGKDTDKIRKRTTDGAATTYTYDTLGRLTKAVETKSGSTTAGWSYCYDKAGNRKGQLQAAPPAHRFRPAVTTPSRRPSTTTQAS
ncbi:hypothetical protein ABZ580_34720 [Streptomyces sp. NPDC012486]|uniref:hypothetical protein n=1 Tax=Streptomyces sp. NPDC012486 TaxID=3156669 RepID=UPI0033F0E65C